MCLKDHEIVELFFERSEQAITELILKYGAAIRNVASNILRNPQDMEECQSDTYLQVWNRIPPTRPSHLGAYVCQIARNVCLKRYHANTAVKRNSSYDVALEEMEHCLSGGKSVEEELEAKELARVIEAFLDTLSEENRVVFMRRYWFADSYSDIAKLTKLAEKTVSVRLVRLRRQLKEYLAERGML